MNHHGTRESAFQGLACGGLAGGKLILAFKFQFKLGLGELLLQLHDLRKQFFVALFQTANRVERTLAGLLTGVCNVNDGGHRSAAQMGAVPDMGAGLFEFWVTAKSHRTGPWCHQFTIWPAFLITAIPSELNRYTPLICSCGDVLTPLFFKALSHARSNARGIAGENIGGPPARP